MGFTAICGGWWLENVRIILIFHLDKATLQERGYRIARYSEPWRLGTFFVEFGTFHGLLIVRQGVFIEGVGVEQVQMGSRADRKCLG